MTKINSHCKRWVKILSGNEIVIDADQMRYDKEKNFLRQVEILLLPIVENIKIYSDNISYDKNIEKIISSEMLK